jgi:WD40 repeat protein
MLTLKCALLCWFVFSMPVEAISRPGPPMPREDRARPVLTLRGHAGAATCVRFSPDGTQLATCGADDALVLWDARRGEKLLTLAGYAASPSCHGLAFSPDGRRLVGRGLQGSVTVWDTKTGRAVLTMPGYTPHWMSFVDISRCGNCLVLAGMRGRWREAEVAVHDAHTGRRLGALGGLPSSAITSLAHSRDGRRLATAGGSGEATVWETATWSAVLTIHRPKGETLTALAFSPDGRRLAAAGSDGMVRVWSLRSGARCLADKGPKGQAESLAFDPSGKCLAVAAQVSEKRGRTAWAGEVIIWDAATGDEWFALLLPERDVAHDLSFSPDGTHLATAHRDGTVKVWWVKDLCVP